MASKSHGTIARRKRRAQALTKKQRALAKEISTLMSVLRISPDLSTVEPALRSTHLELAKRSLVISGVLRRYLLMDEHLNDVLSGDLFPENRPYPQLWHTSKFKAFNYHVLERLYLVQKTEFARARIRLPKKVYKDLLALNDLRNALVHSFFPENRRVKPRWKGFDIFSLEGFQLFWEDTAQAGEFFMSRALRVWSAAQRAHASEKNGREQTS
jgi:hypothetical protein